MANMKPAIGKIEDTDQRKGPRGKNRGSQRVLMVKTLSISANSFLLRELCGNVFPIFFLTEQHMSDFGS